MVLRFEPRQTALSFSLKPDARYATRAMTESTLTSPLPAPPIENDGLVRHDWTLEQSRGLYGLPLFELIDRARAVHLKHHPHDEVQLCTLISVKTGGCQEDCGYCSQSSKHKAMEPQKMLTVEHVLEGARRAKEGGSTRYCMGAAWREIKDGNAFDNVLTMVRGVKELGMEACVTLGMLNETQAQRLKEAGLDSYNHNLDTSRAHYKSLITTRDYDDRLSTLKLVREAGISVCSGGIIGTGENEDDRCNMLIELANMEKHPSSVPVNMLVRVAGTPLEHVPPLDPVELIRMIALARIMMPESKVRLSAGRTDLNREAQMMCMYAGANSIFYGDQLLTTPNPEENEDQDLLRTAGLKGMAPSVQTVADGVPAAE